MPIVDALLPEFDHEMTVTRKLLERVPDDKFDWKPHQKSMSLGQLAQHVATIPMWGSMTLTQTEFDLGGNPQAAAMTTRDRDARRVRPARRRRRARRSSARATAS